MVFEPSSLTATIWTNLSAHAERIWRRLNAGDAWVGATAIEFQEPLLHHDRDFVGLDFSGLETKTLLDGSPT